MHSTRLLRKGMSKDAMSLCLYGLNHSQSLLSGLFEVPLTISIQELRTSILALIIRVYRTTFQELGTPAS